MRILVTGGAGYIGSHAARHLARQGHYVRIYDNLSTGHRLLAQEFDIVVADISDRTRLLAAMDGIDAIMHFAAYAYVGESVQNPRKYFDNNVTAALALLNTVADAQVPYFIFSSSCAIYGDQSEIPITENTLRNPINPYGASKLAFEHALEAYSRAYGLRFVSLRYFNAAGADESGEIGELHDPETHLIPCVLETAAGLRDSVDIYGNDYPTPDGTCIRDYIHVNDLADAHLRALEYLGRSGESIALNLGTGKGHSILEVISMVEQVTGLPVKRRFCSRRPGDPPMLVADPAQAEKTLQWRSTRSLRGIIGTAWNWMRNDESRRSVDLVQRVQFSDVTSQARLTQ
ncbi:MAG TPA: UDP-glucose 4-epimerase GalE [Candidatus Dormibacteraeota bacterium]|nr:UDP-glucose 4-epimerase GalE [Candidatus Dormibacteraeota bacterium]